MPHSKVNKPLDIMREVPIARRAVLASVAAGLGVSPILGYALSRLSEYWWGDYNPSLYPTWDVEQKEWNNSSSRFTQLSYHTVYRPVIDRATNTRKCRMRFRLATQRGTVSNYAFNSVKSIRYGTPNGSLLCYVGASSKDWNVYWGSVPDQVGECEISGPGVHHIRSWQQGYSSANDGTTGSTGESVWEVKVPIPFWIDASAGSGGTITPAGTSNVQPYATQNYTIKPSTGHRIADVIVDGRSVGAKGSHVFSNVYADHTISAVFAKIIFTVIFKAGYGDNAVLKTESVPYGESAHAPQPPARDGYKFTGWDKGFGEIVSDLTVTALWRALARFVYHADGEALYTQKNLDPGAVHSVPAEARAACVRRDCTPGWTGWFTDPACTRPYTPARVPEGTTNLYSYNELTVSFATTSDSAPTTGDFRTAPDEASPVAQLIPEPKVARYGHALALTLPQTCYRNDGDGRWRTYRAVGYFGTPQGNTPPQTRITPKKDTVLYLRWEQAVTDGISAKRGD